MRKTIKNFHATLERVGSRLNWVIIRVPDVENIWGTRGRLPVKGDINGFRFRTSLFPSKKGDHIMIVNKRMQRCAAAVPGSRAKFRLEPDTEKRIATTPNELKRVLAEDKALQRWYEKLNYSTRKWIGDWIQQVKSHDARVRRSEQIAVRLLETMEAEQELPPVLKVAFAREPRAVEGWELMSPSQRRMHLLGIFYYRTPEGRSRRVEKVVEDAIRLSHKKVP